MAAEQREAIRVRFPMTTLLVAANALVALLWGLWAYTSAQYNWINIGGRAGDASLWDSARVVAYAALIAWVALCVAVVLFRRAISPSIRSQVPIGVASLLTGPVVLVACDWLFHLGFPSSPV